MYTFAERIVVQFYHSSVQQVFNFDVFNMPDVEFTVYPALKLGYFQYIYVVFEAGLY